MGNSTKAPSAGEDQRGESAGSQHDEDYIADLKETQGKAGAYQFRSLRSLHAKRLL